MKGMRERVNLEAEEVRGVRHGEALSFKGKIQKREALACCQLNAGQPLRRCQEELRAIPRRW